LYVVSVEGDLEPGQENPHSAFCACAEGQGTGDIGTGKGKQRLLGEEKHFCQAG
jgi:hypothetical protein